MRMEKIAASGDHVKPRKKSFGQFLKISLKSSTAIFMKKTIVTKVISELKSVSRLKIFPRKYNLGLGKGGGG